MIPTLNIFRQCRFVASSYHFSRQIVPYHQASINSFSSLFGRRNFFPKQSIGSSFRSAHNHERKARVYSIQHNLSTGHF